MKCTYHDGCDEETITCITGERMKDGGVIDEYCMKHELWYHNEVDETD